MAYPTPHLLRREAPSSGQTLGETHLVLEVEWATGEEKKPGKVEKLEPFQVFFASVSSISRVP